MMDASNSVVDQLLGSVLPLEIEDEGETGFTAAFAIATRGPAGPIPFLVSSHNAVSRVQRGRFLFALADEAGRLAGKHAAIEFEDFGSLWFRHPSPQVDVAVTPLAPLLGQMESAGKRTHCPVLDASLVVTDSDWPGIDRVEPVVYPCFPAGLFDPRSGRPLLRRGYLATSPDADFSGFPAFLIETSTLPGSAGSPVFTIQRELMPTPEGLGRVLRARLIGVFSQVTRVGSGGSVESVPAPATWRGTREASFSPGIGVAFKAHLIAETAAAFLERLTGPPTA